MAVLPFLYTDKALTRNTRSVFLQNLIGYVVPVLIPFIHIGVISHLWDEYNFKVDKKSCTCPCWDTVFKGIYDRGPGGYKHVYFNATVNSFKIWAGTVLIILLAYEVCKRVVKLCIEREARLSMVILISSSIYPHYYSWWSYFNYWNDEFYEQWNHQMFFCMTEFVSTLMAVHLLDRSVVILPMKVLVIIDIAILHIVSSGFDQFIENVVRGNGFLHQILRDIFFMIPDLLHVILPFLELQKVAKVKQIPTLYLISNWEFSVSVVFVLVGWLICMII